MYLPVLFFIFCSLYVQAQTNTTGTCTIWGDPHLVGFPVNAQQANLRLGYWCQWAGRMLVLENDFIKFHVNVTASPFWNEYYEIELFANSTTLCTITPNNLNCASDLVRIHRPRGQQNSVQIYYDEADNMEISIYSQWIGSHLVYNIVVTQSVPLILASSGLCVNRLRQCEIETSPLGKRAIAEEKATEACDIFIDEAKRSAAQLAGDTSSGLINHAREACISDILLTNDIGWGQSTVWLVVTDTVRQMPLSRAAREELMMQIPSSIEGAVARAQLRVETLLEISTTTQLSSPGSISVTALTPVTSSATILSSTRSEVSNSTSAAEKCSVIDVKVNLILLSLIILIVCCIYD